MGKIIEDNVSLQKLLLVTLFDLSDVEVTGDFDCSNNYLTNLEGSPHTVGGKFNCNKNNLTSLKGGPRIVNGDFDCYNNNLTSLEGAPHTVNGSFYCEINPFTSLTGIPKRPNSSLKTAKIKSVVRSGKKSSWPCEPLSQPLPISPPDQIGRAHV